MSHVSQQNNNDSPTNAVDIPTAVDFLKSHTRPTFDETIEIHIHLGIDPQRSEQMVRGEVVLPSGAPKKKRIAVFAETETQQAAAKKAGAVVVGGDELIKTIQDQGALDADIAVATPTMMRKIAKIARILGPRGLMPNPKTGTVSPDPAKVVKELTGGKLSFKMDQLGNIHEALAKVSWDADKISSNASVFIEAVKQNKPAAAKGKFIHSITLASTMSPGIKIIA